MAKLIIRHFRSRLNHSRAGSGGDPNTFWILRSGRRMTAWGHFAIVAILALIICASYLNSYADTTADLKNYFYNANESYKENKYDQAIKDYESIIEQGYASGNLYYNLGNSYFKNGSFGEAALNYEKALVFIPGDSDLRSNYDYLKSMLNLESQGFSGNKFVRSLDLFSEDFSFDAFTLFLSILFWIFFTLLAVAMFFARLKKFLNPALIFISLMLLLGSICLVRKIDNFNQAAIVVSKGVEAKFEPAENSMSHFELGEGAKVQVLELSGGWYKLRRLDGLVGWVEQSALSRFSEGR